MTLKDMLEAYPTTDHRSLWSRLPACLMEDSTGVS